MSWTSVAVYASEYTKNPASHEIKEFHLFTVTSRKVHVGVRAAALGSAVLLLAACSSSPSEESTVDEPLRIGSILPFTAYAGAGEGLVAAVELAVNDINEAGGAFGRDVELRQVDSTDNNDTAIQAVNELATYGADIVVGAYGSGMSGAIVGSITEAGAIQIAGSNTSSSLTGINPWYFRTAPTDVLEAQLIANTMVADGHSSAAIIYQRDAWGEAFDHAMTDALEGAGIELTTSQGFNTTDTDYTAQVDAVVASAPDSVILLSYAAYSGPMVSSLVGTHGYTSDNVYFSNSTLGVYDASYNGVLEGMRGFLAGPEPERAEAFNERLLEVEPSLKSFAYAAATYDAVVVGVLAAIAADSVEAEDIEGSLRQVSGSPADGEKCTSFAECVEVLDAGNAIDYDGVTGGLAFDESGDTTETNYNLFTYNADGAYEVAD